MANLFIRHGEVENIKNIQYANIPGFHLSKVGCHQAEKAALKIKKNFHIEKIVSSPLLRARETTYIINKVLNVDVKYSHNMTEWKGQIDWIGLTFNEISKKSNFAIEKLKLTDVNEKLFDVFIRVNHLYQLNKNTLFVSHQDTIRAFTYYFLKQQVFEEFRPNHCEIQEIKENKIFTY